MSNTFPDAADLPRTTSTEAQAQWDSVVRSIHETGALAVTRHDQIELVVLSVERYQALIRLSHAPHKAGLDFLAGRFQVRLERMQAGSIREGAAAFMDDDGDFSDMEKPIVRP